MFVAGMTIKIHHVAVRHLMSFIPIKPFKDEAQTAVFKDPVRTAL